MRRCGGRGARAQPPGFARHRRAARRGGRVRAPLVGLYRDLGAPADGATGVRPGSARSTPWCSGRAAARRHRDLELLARWREEFAGKATGGLRGPGTARQQATGSLVAGNAALLWEIGGHPVAWASATAPVAGMSRIGPVYTPPRYRGHGYGSAVTAAAAGWARQAGAKHVVLFTDLANPISNAIYPRVDFRPVHDAVEIAFTRSPERGLAWRT